jgi:hypothetical protein
LWSLIARVLTELFARPTGVAMLVAVALVAGLATVVLRHRSGRTPAVVRVRAQRTRERTRRLR